jgi:hypothetical protein
MMKPWCSMAFGMPKMRISQAIGITLFGALLPAWSQVPSKTSTTNGAKTQSAPVKQAKAKPQKPTAPLEVDTLMGPDELAIAERVHKGQLPCELGATVRLEADASQPGYFYLHGKGFRYRMHPVATSSGAIRLEDRKAGAVWLQLANKSMLMDQKKGRRLADECANAEQLAFAEDMKTNPPPSLMDTTGMGR